MPLGNPGVCSFYQDVRMFFSTLIALGSLLSRISWMQLTATNDRMITEFLKLNRSSIQSRIEERRDFWMRIEASVKRVYHMHIEVGDNLLDPEMGKR